MIKVKGILILSFMLVIALEANSMAHILTQLGFIVAISTIYILVEKKEARIRRLKSPVFFPGSKK